MTHGGKDLFYQKLDCFRRKAENDTEFATRLGVSRQVFSAWKLGKHRPQREVFTRIIGILNTTEEKFWNKKIKRTTN